MSSTEERLAELEACMDRMLPLLERQNERLAAAERHIDALLEMTEQGNEAMRKMLTIVAGEGSA